MAKKKGMHCQNLLIKSDKRGALQNFLKGMVEQIEKLPKTQPVKWVLDVDPVDM
jgi:primosomal protein N'